MYIFAEPVTEDQIADIQASNAAKVEEFETSVKGDCTEQKVSSAHGGQESLQKVQPAVPISTKEVQSGTNESGMQISEVTAPQKADVMTTQGLPSPVAVGSQTTVLETSDPESSQSEGANLEASGMKASKPELPCVGIEAQKGLGDQAEDLKLPTKNRKTEADVSSADEVEAKTTESGSDAPATDGEAKLDSNLVQNGLKTGVAAKRAPPTEREGHDLDGNDEGASLHSSSKSTKNSDKETSASQNEVLGMTLTICNRVNGIYMDRPDDLKYGQEWEVEYSLTELKNSKAWNLYQACQKRRKKALEDSDASGRIDHYRLLMRQLSQRGAKHREMVNSLQKGSKFNEKVVYGRSSSDNSRHEAEPTAATDPTLGPSFRRVKIRSMARPPSFRRLGRGTFGDLGNVTAMEAIATAPKSPLPATAPKRRRKTVTAYTYVPGSMLVRRPPTSRLTAMRIHEATKRKKAELSYSGSVPKGTGKKTIVSLSESKSDEATISL